jgi:hypothetical protein
MAIETWEHEGQKWKTITHETRERYIVGVDLGHSCDPTAICVMHYKRTPLRDKPAWHKANSSIPKRGSHRCRNAPLLVGMQTPSQGRSHLTFLGARDRSANSDYRIGDEDELNDLRREATGLD